MRTEENSEARNTVGAAILQSAKDAGYFKDSMPFVAELVPLQSKVADFITNEINKHLKKGSDFNDAFFAGCLFALAKGIDITSKWHDSSGGEIQEDFVFNEELVHRASKIAGFGGGVKDLVNMANILNEGGIGWLNENHSRVESGELHLGKEVRSAIYTISLVGVSIMMISYGHK